MGLTEIETKLFMTCLFAALGPQKNGDMTISKHPFALKRHGVLSGPRILRYLNLLKQHIVISRLRML